VRYTLSVADGLARRARDILVEYPGHTLVCEGPDGHCAGQARGDPPGRTALTGDGGASPAARAAAEFRSQTRSRDPGREPWWVDRVAPLSPAVRHLSTPAALEPTASLLVSRRPRRLSGSGVADPGFCSWSAARLSGSPRAGFSVGDEPEAGLAPTTRPGSSPRGAGSSRCGLPLRPIVSKNSASTRFPVLAMSRELQVPGRVAPAFALLAAPPLAGPGFPPSAVLRYSSRRKPSVQVSGTWTATSCFG
jgi:hypothetical protein